MKLPPAYGSHVEAPATLVAGYLALQVKETQRIMLATVYGKCTLLVDTRGSPENLSFPSFARSPVHPVQARADP